MSERQELSVSDLEERWRSKTVDESLDGAIACYSNDEYKDSETALRWLLLLAWSELQDARRQAMNGLWSMACDYAVHRIIGLTSLIGPMSWDEVPADLVVNGMYKRIHQSLGIETPLSKDDLKRAQECIDRRLRP